MLNKIKITKLKFNSLLSKNNWLIKILILFYNILLNKIIFVIKNNKYNFNCTQKHIAFIKIKTNAIINKLD